MDLQRNGFYWHPSLDSCVRSQRFAEERPNCRLPKEGSSLKLPTELISLPLISSKHPPLPHNASLLAASFRRALRRLNGCCVREANTLRRLVRSPSRRCSPLRSTRVHEFLVTGSGRMLHPVIFQDTTRIQPGAGSNILRQVQTCAPSPLWPRRSAA